MTPDRRIFARFHAIFATGCVLLASLGGLGCSSSSTAPAAPAENYADNEGDNSDAGVVIDAGADDRDAAPDPRPGKADDDGGCPVLAFPSGVNIRTKADAALTAEYTSISDTSDYPLPVCFIDTDDLYDPTTGDINTIDVMVGAHFALSELVGTELPYGHKVLLSPTLVAKLDAYRDALGSAVDLTSGYRSPAHQRATCQGLCGMDSCPETCAARSRHSWGDAADHGVVPSATYANAGCAAKFNYVFREGNHMHLDLNPEHKICTVDIL